MRFNKLLFIFIILIMMLGCKYENQKSTHKVAISQDSDSCDCEIISINSLYYNYFFNTARAKNWDDLVLNIPDFKNNSHGILNASITNCNTLKEIDKELKTLKASDQLGDADIRIIFSVNYKNRKDTTLCIGGYFASDIVNKERVGLTTENTNRLIYLIKNNIGYYTWFDDNDYKYMDELKDTTFVKEPFIESPYYKLYKENNKKRRQTHD